MGLLVAVLTFFAVSMTHAQVLNPGVHATWIQVKRSFQGPSNYSISYNGLWTLKDAEYVLTKSKKSDQLRSLKTVVPQINFSDSLYENLWANSYGHSSLVPLFANDGNHLDIYPDRGYRATDIERLIEFFNEEPLSQNDYISFFQGHIYIERDGEYEFLILNDDGFRFQIGKHTLSDQSIEPLHPRAWFSIKVPLKKGYHPFSLLALEHLEASIIRLAWKKNDRVETIPVTNLFH